MQKPAYGLGQAYTYVPTPNYHASPPYLLNNVTWYGFQRAVADPVNLWSLKPSQWRASTGDEVVVTVKYVPLELVVTQYNTGQLWYYTTINCTCATV